MIDIYVDPSTDDVAMRVIAHGPIDDVVAELSIAISKLYRQIMGESSGAAEVFRRFIQLAFASDSPVWAFESSRPGFSATCVVDLDELRRQQNGGASDADP